MRAKIFLRSFQNNFVGMAHFGEPDFYRFIHGRRNVFANEVSLDRQFAMTTINQHRELDTARPAEIIQRIHRGPDSATAEENIINQHNRLTGDVDRDFGWLDIGSDAAIQIVAMHADIQTSCGNWMVQDLGESLSQALGKRNATALDSNDYQLRRWVVAFNDFVGDAGKRPLHRLRVEQDGGICHALGNLTGLPLKDE
jgi:hypothetical protein